MSFERADGKQQGSIRFDLFELDERRGQLRRGGLPVDLPPQALRVLGILAERPDQLVTRKEIQEALWPGQSYGDFDSRLNFAVKRLREALGDDAEQPRYVQTVRNAGYRFIAPVREGQASAGLTDSVEHSISGGSALRQPGPGTLAGDAGLQLGRNGLLLVLVTLVVMAGPATVVLLLRQGVRGGMASSDGRMQPAANQAEYEPHILSVTPIFPDTRQRIVIRGRGLGLHVPYARTDSPYLAIRDLSAHWAAGRMIPQNSDEVMVDVESWMDTEIVIGGFSGDYGMNGWTLTAGDVVEVAVWNPQSGLGPGLYRVRVITRNAAR